MADPVSALEQLVTMRERGLITEEEFQAKRAEVLERMRPVPAPAAPPPPAVATAAKKTNTSGALGCLVIVLVGSALYAVFGHGGPGPTAPPAAEPTALGAKTDVVTYLEGLGFDGSESPLSDGTPRWLGHRSSDSANAEAIGPSNAIDRVSITVGTGVDDANAAGAFIGSWVDHFAPSGGRAALSSMLDDYGGTTDIDESRHIGDRSIHVQTLTAVDGVIVVVTIDHD